MFSKIELEDFQVSPFPHVVKEDFMESQYFRALILELKKIEPIKRRIWSGDSNKTVVAGNEWFPESENIENFPMIKKVWQYLDSNSFYNPLIKEWSDYLPSRFGITGDYVTNILSEAKETRLMFDVAGDRVKIRDPHIDNSKSVLAWRYYCRLPEDESIGGDFCIYSYKRGFRGFKLKTLVDVRYLSDEDITLENTIRFKANTLVIFLNGIDSVHGVTDRQNAKISRVNFSGGISLSSRRMKEPMNVSPIYKTFYYPTRSAQRVICKVMKILGYGYNAYIP